MSERFVETNGVRLWCQTLGDPGAPPVVLVSGAWTTAMWWYPEFIDGLTDRGWRVVRFDNRDIGLDLAANAVALGAALSARSRITRSTVV